MQILVHRGHPSRGTDYYTLNCTNYQNRCSHCNAFDIFFCKKKEYKKTVWALSPKVTDSNNSKPSDPEYPVTVLEQFRSGKVSGKFSISSISVNFWNNLFNLKSSYNAGIVYVSGTSASNLGPVCFPISGPDTATLNIGAYLKFLKNLSSKNVIEAI